MNRERKRERHRKEVLSELARAGFLSSECLYAESGLELNRMKEKL